MIIRQIPGAGAAKAAARLRRAAPHLMNVSLALIAVGMWARLVAHVVDYWDGLSADRREDFVAFYAAAAQVRDGLASTIYQPEVIAHVEEVLLGRSAGRVDGLAFMNPPFVAGLLQPLTLLPYGVAQAVWFVASALAVASSIALLWPDLRKLRGRWALTFALAAIASYPVYMSMLYGQLSPVVLLAWVLSYRLGVKGYAVHSGLALSLSLIKPQLAVVPVLYLLVTGRWRTLAGFCGGAIALAGLSVALAGTQVAFVGYPAFLLESLGWHEEFGVNRMDMFGWHAFFIRALPGSGAGLGLLLAALLSLATLLAAAIVWHRRRGFEDMWAPTLAIAAATILVSPHVHTHDLLILMLPAALLVARRRDALSVAAAALLLFAVPMAMIGINLATPMLAAVLITLVLLVLAGERGWRGMDGPAPSSTVLLPPSHDWQAAETM